MLIYKTNTINTRPVLEQLRYYANTGVNLGALSLEAFNALNGIYNDLQDEQEEAGDDPDDFTRWDSRDFKAWLKQAIDNDIYTEDNLN